MSSLSIIKAHCTCSQHLSGRWGGGDCVREVEGARLEVLNGMLRITKTRSRQGLQDFSRECWAESALDKADGGGGLGLPCSGVLTVPATQEGGGDPAGCEARHQGFVDLGQLLIIISKLMQYLSLRESFEY